MYYNRTLSVSFSGIIEENGKYRWLFEFVKGHPELDLLIGKNKTKEWISVYRGLSRIITILKTKNPSVVKIDGADAFKKINPGLYGTKSTSIKFVVELEVLITKMTNNEKFSRYYENMKEGYYQNELSRKFGINGAIDNAFVIIDKEAVIGYENQPEKELLMGKIQQKYKQLQNDLSITNPKRYGSKLVEKAVGNELDFIALNKDGELLLIEYKDGSNTSGIYLSPLQIGLYYDLFCLIPQKELEKTIFDMLEQKKKIGLIHPGWKRPERIKKIIPVLIISEYKESSAKEKYQEVLNFCREKKGNDFLKDIRTYNYTSKSGLTDW